MIIKRLTTQLSTYLRLKMMAPLFFLIRGRIVRIGSCRYGFLSATRDYRWVDKQITAVNEALEYLISAQDRSYYLRFSNSMKSYVFFNGEVNKLPKVIIGGHTIVKYKAGVTDNALVLAGHFVYYCRCMELITQAQSGSEIDWFQARTDQFEFLSLHSSWLPTLRWLWRNVQSSFPSEAVRLRNIWDVRWGPPDGMDQNS